MLSETEEQAIKLLLESDCAVVRVGWHISKTKTGEYLLLNFNEDGNLLRDKEESYPDINDAVSKFVRRTKL